jgi:hypothetical protein
MVIIALEIGVSLTTDVKCLLYVRVPYILQ